jgi:hypothetical protein
MIDHKKRKEKLTIWVDPIDIDKIRLKAKKAGASLSSVAGEALKKASRRRLILITASVSSHSLKRPLTAG